MTDHSTSAYNVILRPPAHTQSTAISPEPNTLTDEMSLEVVVDYIEKEVIRSIYKIAYNERNNDRKTKNGTF